MSGRAWSWFFALALAFGLAACDEPEVAAPHPVEVMPNDTWISVSGTVVDPTDDAFTLDYGPDTILVEVDDWDRWGEARSLIENDQVVVYGFIDHDFFEARSIEAQAVYVESLGTQFYASGADEEDFPVTARIHHHPTIELSGTVMTVSDGELTLDTGAGILDVNVSRMLYDPLDEEGFQRIEPGDRIRVSGRLGWELFTDLDLFADTITTMEQGGEAPPVETPET